MFKFFKKKKSKELPKKYFFDPQDDINNEEILYILKLTFLKTGFRYTEKALNEMPENMRKHFSEAQDSYLEIHIDEKNNE